jgi:cyanophycinase
MKIYTLLLATIVVLLNSCFGPQPEPVDYPEGKLFIIGGGSRPQEMMNEMVKLSISKDSDYALVLPQSSSEPDTSFYYVNLQFVEAGLSNVINYNFSNGDSIPDSMIDSLKNASLIYITGGDQSKFMKAIANTTAHEAIEYAYQNGAVIAGTSAGAAVMSEKMITGNEFKYPEYTGDFRTIEANNLEIKQGLGLIKTAIIDQHFIWRMRLNRLLAAVLENPDLTGIGIDESTAIVVERDYIRVVGESQVIMVNHTNKKTSYKNDLMGAISLQMDILLPGDSIRFK